LDKYNKNVNMKLSILLEALDIKRLTDKLRQIINTCLEFVNRMFVAPYELAPTDMFHVYD